MLNFWNLPKRLRPKIWPKEGQNFSKFKNFKILNEDKKNYNKTTIFCTKKNEKLLRSFGFEGPLSQKETNKQTNEDFFCFLKSGYFVIIFLILI